MENETPTPAEAPAIKRKDHFKGKVTRITLAGAVIDLGLERPGFLHLTELGDSKIKNVDDVLEVGQELDVWVKRPAPSKPFIELTISEPLGLEWRDIKKGMTVTGKVEKIERFGAFVEIGAERPGLIHVSEMSHDYIRSPEEVVKVGEQVEARVLDVNRKKRQIKLSMKALTEKPGDILQAMNDDDQEVDNSPVATAMEFALRAAMDRSPGAKNTKKKNKPEKRSSKALEDFYSRTLENYTEE